MRDIGYTIILADEDSRGFMSHTNSSGKITPSRIANGNPLEMNGVASERLVNFAAVPTGDADGREWALYFTRHHGRNCGLLA
jgi:hypothetical protein